MLAIATGLFFPYGQGLKFILPYLLSGLIFIQFVSMKLTLDDLRYFFKKQVLFLIILNFIISPVVIYFLSIKLGSDIRSGLFLIAIAPTAIGSSVVISIVGGDIKLAIVNTIVTNLLTPFTYSILFTIFFSENVIQVPVKIIFVKLLIMIIIPFIIAIVLKVLDYKLKFVQENKRYMDPVTKIMPYISQYFLIFMIYIAVSSASVNFKNTETLSFIIIAFFTILLSISLFTIGFFMSSKSETRLACSITAGQKNTALSIFIALEYLNPIASIPPTLYIIIHHLINSFIIWRVSKKANEFKKK